MSRGICAGGVVLDTGFLVRRLIHVLHRRDRAHDGHPRRACCGGGRLAVRTPQFLNVIGTYAGQLSRTGDRVGRDLSVARPGDPGGCTRQSLSAG
jgi:hypothetical protein